MINQSCGQFNLTFDNTEEIEFAKTAMKAVQKGDKEELKKLIHEDVLKTVTEKQLDQLMKDGYTLLNTAELPMDSLIQESNNVTIHNGKKIEIAQLSFPFTLKGSSSKDSIVYMNVSVADHKILSMNVNQYPFGRRIIEPSHSEPHLDQHSLSYESINWFRIWYGSGFEKNDYGDRYGYYAVSGDRKKMDKLKIQKELSDLFDLINTTKADSTDFKYLRDESVGQPEYIYLRFKFDNAPYNQFGEFSIYHHLKDQPGKPEPMSKYIIIEHSDKTRYLYLVSKNPEMVELLRKISYNRYDKYFERRWM
jgi:hypothetical protein